MSETPTITELELQGLSPHGLDEDFMARLAACADGSITSLSEEELEFENTLRAITPRGVPSKLRASLEDAISDTPFAVDEKIVLFHKSGPGKSATGSKSSSKILRFNIAAAAAVALLGSLAALMIPAADVRSDGTASNTEKSNLAVPAKTIELAPTGFNRKLSDTRDEGVIWQGNNEPHRVLRLKYLDRMTLQNGEGETLQVEQPTEEYLIIPEKID